MKPDSSTRLEKRILLIICLLAVIILAGTLYLLRPAGGTGKSAHGADDGTDPADNGNPFRPGVLPP